MDKTAKVATKTDPAKWEAAKSEAKAKMGGKHSARAMQLATQIYKKKGGGYSGAKPTSQNNSLKKWTKQKWRWSGEKTAASRLRSSFRLVSSKAPRGPSRHDFYLGDQHIGAAITDKVGPHSISENLMNPSDRGLPQVIHMEIDPEYRGLGLGRKAYGELMRRTPKGTLLSDYDVSPAARRVWERLKKNPGYGIEGSRPFGSTIYRGKITPKALIKEKTAGKGVYLPAAKISRLKSTPEGRKRLAAAARKKAEATRKGEQYSSHGLAAGTSLKEKQAMNIFVFRAMNDELAKIAVSTKDMYRGVRRAENVFIGTSRSPIHEAVSGGGAVTIPPKRVLKRNADKFVQKEKDKIEAYERLAEKMPKRMKDEIKKRTEFDVEDFQKGLKELRENLEPVVIKNTQRQGLDLQLQGAEARKEIRRNRKKTAKNIKHHGARTLSPTEMKSAGYGAIGLDRNAISKILPAMAGVSRKSGNKATDEINLRALIAAAGSHELAERAVKSKDVTRYASHLSPDVLMKEHNLLSRLEGPGADYARKVLRKTRKISGEAEDMEALLVEAFGPRASQFLQEGEKVPSAMRKALLSELRKDPTLLNRAVKRAAKKRGVVGTAKSLAGRMAQFKRMIEAQGA